MTDYADHISTVSTESVRKKVGRGFVPGAPDLDGICHCDPQPESSPIGECPTCRRLDVRKAFA